MSSKQETAVSLAKQLAQDFATRADEADKAGTLPQADVDALKSSGYLGLTIPKEFGGYGLSLRDAVACQLELAQGSASSAMVAGMQVHIFGHQREVRQWDEAWYAQLSRAGIRDALFNVVASEPAMGSPSRGGLPASTAVPVEGGLLVNGRKTWSTGGAHITHLLARVTLNDAPVIVLIKQGTPGMEWVPTWSDSLSLRASDSHDVIFKDVLIPSNYIIEQGKPDKPMPNVWFPMIMSSIYLGSAIAARNCVIQFALERVPTALGKPIATLPKIQRQIGEIDVALRAAKALLFDVAADWTGLDDDRDKMVAQIAAAKTMVTETANDVTDKALRIAGGTSITKSLPLERFFRDVRAGSMQPPSGDTALEIVGRAAIAEIENQ